MASIEHPGLKLERPRSWIADLADALWSDRTHYALIFGYILMALALVSAFGRNYWAEITGSYLVLSIRTGLATPTPVAVLQLVWTLARDRPRSPFKAATDQLALFA